MAKTKKKNKIYTEPLNDTNRAQLNITLKFNHPDEDDSITVRFQDRRWFTTKQRNYIQACLRPRRFLES